MRNSDQMDMALSRLKKTSKHSKNTLDAFSAHLLMPQRAVPPDFRSPLDDTPDFKRYDIYKNNVAASLVEALTDTYPVVHDLVGAEYFKAVAIDYVRRYPPTSPVLFEYGAQFPQFLMSYRALTDYPYISDVARIELACVKAYHAEDEPSLLIQELANLSPDSLLAMRLQLTSSLSVIGSQFPAGSIWLHETSDLSRANLPDLHCAENILVFRARLDVCCKVVDPVFYDFVLSIMKGSSLSDSCDSFENLNDENALQNAIGTLFSWGLVHAISIEENT